MLEMLEPRVLLAEALSFAVIGDYGEGNAAEAAVARLVHSWEPDLIITTGDNNYPSGAAKSIDKRIGAYYHDYIYPYKGRFGGGSPTLTNRFFPTLGNHDWIPEDARPYRDYFKLPGNERYYRFKRGPVEFFAIDSDPSEPGFAGARKLPAIIKSPQAQWLKKGLAASTAPWQVVYFHHAPYSSGTRHGSIKWMRWPFQAWGADVVFSGHDHDYERVMVNGLPFFVDGCGGGELYNSWRLIPGSQVRYGDDYGAMKVEATAESMTFQFITRRGEVIDTYAVQKPAAIFSNALITVDKAAKARAA